MSSVPSDADAAAARPPALLIRIELEQPAKIVLDAARYEDELRLRAWLRRSEVFRRLPGILERFLDDLDEADARSG